MSRQKSLKSQGEEFSELRVSEAIANKSWAARKRGYEAVANIFGTLEPRSPQWDSLSILVKGISEERNVAALEKGLEAALMFVQMCQVMKDETVTDLLNGILLRCLADPKIRIRDLATEICMMLFEKKKHELVMTMLLERIEGRNAKQAFACIRTLTRALVSYGPSLVDVSLVTPRIASLCVNKSMFQQEVKDLLREIYANIGVSIREHLASLDSSQLKTMEIEFAKVDKAKADKLSATKMDSDQQSSKNLNTARPKSIKSKPSPTRTFQRPLSSKGENGLKKVTETVKSPITGQAKRNTSAKTGNKDDGGASGDRFSTRNRNSVQPRVGLNDIFCMIESKHWKERGEALDAILKMIDTDSEIKSTAYNKIIKCLRILILNDTNVLLISKAVQCVTALAKKENHEFRQHAPLMITLLLEKFKDKKTVLVDAIREATDSIYETCCFGTIVRYIALGLEHQNPAVKSETELFVWRIFSKPSTEILKSIYWHQLVGNLVKNLSYQDQTVRTNATKALGAMMKAVGDHNLRPLLRDVQNHHMNAIYKFRDEVVLEFRLPNSSTECSSDQSSDALDKYDEGENNSKLAKYGVMKGLSSSAADKLARRSFEECETSLNCHDQLYDSYESNGSDRSKRRTSSPKSSKVREDENKQRRKIVIETGPDESDGRKGSPKKKVREKNLSPEAQQRLNTLRSTIEQLKSTWSESQNPRLPNNSPKRYVEREIAKKLENLESNVGSCFEEIRHLSPLLYHEMDEPDSLNGGSPTVLKEFNKRLVRMEGLLKSMAFDEDAPHTAEGTVTLVPAVIRQGNGNWFVDGGY